LGGKVTFTTRPRERLEEIYDREEEIKQLVELLKKNEWVALLGSRMSGKTSLAKAVSHSLDSRVVYVDLIKSKNLLDVLSRIYQAMSPDVISRIKENFSFIGLGPLKVKIKQKLLRKLRN
jgi:AAA+ ATPase superfamily predicted ATPase